MRKHTIPVPFSLKSSHRECREELSKKFPKSTKQIQSPNSQRTFSRLVNFSALKQTPKVSPSINEISTSKTRAFTPSPFKGIQFIQKSADELEKNEKRSQWKKIIATVKKNFDENVVTKKVEKKMKVMKCTVDRIKLFDVGFERKGIEKTGVGIGEDGKSK